LHKNRSALFAAELGVMLHEEMVMGFEESHLLIAFATYLIATASPGPATIAIMDIAMNEGRKSALIFSFGVLQKFRVKS
jgi:hypothetical protein